jgi:hypothetical protein
MATGAAARELRGASSESSFPIELSAEASGNTVAPGEPHSYLGGCGDDGSAWLIDKSLRI